MDILVQSYLLSSSLHVRQSEIGAERSWAKNCRSNADDSYMGGLRKGWWALNGIVEKANNDVGRALQCDCWHSLNINGVGLQWLAYNNDSRYMSHWNQYISVTRGNTTINTSVDTLPHTCIWKTHFLCNIPRHLESSLSRQKVLWVWNHWTVLSLDKAQ